MCLGSHCARSLNAVPESHRHLPNRHPSFQLAGGSLCQAPLQRVTLWTSHGWFWGILTANSQLRRLVSTRTEEFPCLLSRFRQTRSPLRWILRITSRRQIRRALSDTTRQVLDLLDELGTSGTFLLLENWRVANLNLLPRLRRAAARSHITAMRIFRLTGTHPIISGKKQKRTKHSSKRPRAAGRRVSRLFVVGRNGVGGRCAQG